VSQTIGVHDGRMEGRKEESKQGGKPSGVLSEFPINLDWVAVSTQPRPSRHSLGLITTSTTYHPSTTGAFEAQSHKATVPSLRYSRYQNCILPYQQQQCNAIHVLDMIEIFQRGRHISGPLQSIADLGSQQLSVCRFDRCVPASQSSSVLPSNLNHVATMQALYVHDSHKLTILQFEKHRCSSQSLRLYLRCEHTKCCSF